MKKPVQSLLILSLLLVLVSPQLVRAEEGSSGSNSTNTTQNSNLETEPKTEAEIENKREELKNRAEKRMEERKGRIASRAAERKEKLDEKKQKVCENRSEKINKRSEQLAKRAENQLNKFTSIAERVDKFYLNKLVPKGVTVSNYSALKADIEARKQEVKDAIAAAKAAAVAFSCTDEDPKGQLGTFHNEMKDAVAALKDFRTSIKNFIVAVRTAVAKSNNATNSAESGG